MIRMDEHELTKASIGYASRYTEGRMRGAPIVEKSLTINCAAHGFFMGARFVESRYNRWWWPARPVRSTTIARHSVRAARYYMEQRMQGLTQDLAAIVHVAVMKGFSEGAQYREEQLTS